MKKVQGMAAAVLAAGMLLASPVWAAEKPASVVQATGVGGGVRTVAPQGITEAQKPVLTAAQKQALEKVYHAVPELKELSVQDVSDEGGKAWFVMLGNRTPGTEGGIQGAYAYLTFDTATGELLSYNFQNPAWASEKVPSPALAREKAAAFARQILGDKIKDYVQGDDMGFGGGGSADEKGNKIYWSEANVPYYRLVNGVPLMNNSGFRVGVDVFGHIINFYRQREEGIDQAKFPDPSRAVTREEAEKAFAGMLEMKLFYLEHQPFYGLFKPEKGETGPALVYAPTSLAPIDALTGRPLAEFLPSLPPSQRITLQGEGRQLIARTPEEAAKLLIETFGLDLTGMQFHGASDVESFNDREIKQKSYTWSTIPQKGADGKPVLRQARYVHLITNASTGEVISYNLQDESGRGQKATVSREAAQNTAVQFLQKYLPAGPAEMEMQVYPEVEERIPAWVDKSKLKDQERPLPVISFTFNQVHQGVPVMDRAFSVRVDALSGKIVGFHNGINGAPVPLPDNRNVVPAETAKAEFLKQHPLKLVYIWPEYFDQKAPSPYLVYIPVPGPDFYYVDAFTGKTVQPENK
ncbi:YcdB/YcdC domain-containing protein [Neomoorella carbonis]|uniref:YcdB/YcdC domain-containing protein n=1 Tax=Neomoorella carbonis TaxID=3062783 RepID=UPI0032546EC4